MPCRFPVLLDIVSAILDDTATHTYIWIFNFSDMAGLARAAVNGDEKALDMFSWTNGPKLSSSLTANSFFFGTADGKYFTFALVQTVPKFLKWIPDCSNE